MLIDEKAMLPFPPPPYAAVGRAVPPEFPDDLPRDRTTLATLPPALLLRIMYELFPQGQVVGQRRVLYWMTTQLRRVCRSSYIACMHILRSTYLPAYASLIRPPYTTDPFPSLNEDGSDPTASPVQTFYREVHVLDLFLAVKSREDVWSDESELHLGREELVRDIFDVMQPRARLEDLVRVYGTQEGIVLPQPTSALRQASTTSARARLPAGVRPVPFGLLSVAFSPRKVGLVIVASDRRRTIVEVHRTREESLESSAWKLVRDLKVWLCSTAQYSTGR